MPPKQQKIYTILIPESGLDLEPEFIEQSLVSTDFSRVFAHLIGKSADRGILIRATSDGRLQVATAGVPFEAYLIHSGTGADAHAAGQTHESALSYNVTDFLIETHPAIISFRNHAGVWLGDKIIPVGMHSVEFIHYGIRVRNRGAGNNTAYELTIYR